MFVLTTEQNISLITMSIPPTPALLQEIRTQFRWLENCGSSL